MEMLDRYITKDIQYPLQGLTKWMNKQVTQNELKSYKLKRSQLSFLYVCVLCMSVYIQGSSIDLERFFRDLARQSTSQRISFHGGRKLYICMYVCLYIYLLSICIMYECMSVFVYV